MARSAAPDSLSPGDAAAPRDGWRWVMWRDERGVSLVLLCEGERAMTMSGLARRVAGPLGALAGCLALADLLAGATWLGLTPSPLTGGARRWTTPPGWNAAGSAPVGATLPQPSGGALLLFAALLVGAAGAALVAARRAREAPGDRRTLGALLAVAAGLGLLALLMPAQLSDDVFSYTLYGRIIALYHANPLLTTPAQFPQDPFLRAVFWRDTRSIYGPLWLSLSAGLTWLAQGLGGALATYVTLYKLVGLGCHLANAALIWGILTRWAPERRVFGTALYAWNPLAVLEFAGSGHNDALMLTLLLLGIWLLARGHERWALVAFGGSIAVKYVALALAPLWLWHVARGVAPRAGEAPWRWRARQGWAALWRGGVILGVVVALAAPYWAGPATLVALVASPPAQQLGNSLADMVSWPARSVVVAVGPLTANQARTVVIGGLKLGGVVAFALVWLWLLWRRAASDWLGAWLWATLAYLILASGLYWPWYATWPLALAALRPWGRGTAVALWLAAGSLALYGFLPLMAAPVYGFRAVVVFGPALVTAARGWWRGRMGERGDGVTAEMQPRLGS